MFAPLDLKEFYSETLKQAGFTPPDDQIEKFAAANQLDVETTKMASAIFEQLQLDGVKYDSHQDMFQDALKIANAYADHVKEASAQAEKIAGDLHRIARHAVEGYLAQHSIQMDADEGVKIAGLQASSFQKLMQKQAALHQPEGEAKEATFAQFRRSHPAGLNEFDADSSVGAVNQHIGGTPQDLQMLKNHMTAANIPVERQPEYFNNLHHEMTSTGQNFQQSHANVVSRMSAPPKSPGLMGRPGLLMGAGALGLGAMYMMKKRREEAAQRQSNIMGAAGMPAA